MIMIDKAYSNQEGNNNKDILTISKTFESNLKAIFFVYKDMATAETPLAYFAWVQGLHKKHTSIDNYKYLPAFPKAKGCRGIWRRFWNLDALSLDEGQRRSQLFM